MCFKPLQEELQKWSDLDRIAQIWWRDDDAQMQSAGLDQLLAISKQYQVPLSLAAIPDGVQTSLAERISGLDLVCVLQHGFSHHSYAPATERKMELGWHRPGEQISGQIVSGRNKLQSLFGKQFIPVMVPPWNRIDPRVIEGLKAAGLNGLSTLGPRQQAMVVDGVKQVNVHVDIIDWKQGRCFAGERSCVEQIVTHLSAKREGRVDPDEPTGIMSHHQVHDEGCWDFLEDLCGFLLNQAGARVESASVIFK